VNAVRKIRNYGDTPIPTAVKGFGVDEELSSALVGSFGTHVQQIGLGERFCFRYNLEIQFHRTRP
jgi:hypothetical protein